MPLGCGAVVLFVCLVLVGCLEAESTRCSWGGYCPPGMSCHDESKQCVVPSQWVDCVGKEDRDPCTVFGQSAPYICVHGVCLRSLCGDGLLDDRVEVGEVCDDGNTEPGDGCRADCKGTEICGDGQVDEVTGEACDDENQDNEDGCTQHCQPPYCGDGLRTGGETCDDGDDNSNTRPDACRTTCRPSGCGDRVLDAAERGQCWLLTADGRQATQALPRNLTVGDLDGDGLSDLAVINQDASSLSVFTSDGVGGLDELPGSPIHLGHPLAAAAFGDLDGDSTPDLLVVSDDGHLAWLPGEPGGGLAAPIHGWQPASFTDVILADLTGNGDVEILATDQQADSVWVLRVGADDAFEVVDTYSVGASGVQPVALAAADLDGDGNLEIAVANRAYAQLSLLSSDSAGDLHMVPDFPRYVGAHWSSTVGEVIIADADDNGTLDLVWLDVRAWTGSWVGTLLGDGNLVFTADASGLIEVGPGAMQMAAGDLDADGLVDLMAPRVTDTSVYLLLGDATATFVLNPDGPVELEANSWAVALADFDGDGLPDLVLADQYAGYVDLYLNTP